MGISSESPATRGPAGADGSVAATAGRLPDESPSLKIGSGITNTPLRVVAGYMLRETEPCVYHIHTTPYPIFQLHLRTSSSLKGSAAAKAALT